MVAGTPYAKNGLGTVSGFAHDVNSKNLLNFYSTWYHPNNATYVIVGDVDGPSTDRQGQGAVRRSSRRKTSGSPAGEVEARHRERPITTRRTSRSPSCFSAIACPATTARTMRPDKSSPTCSTTRAARSARCRTKGKRSSPVPSPSVSARRRRYRLRRSFPSPASRRRSTRAMRDDFAAYAKSGVPDDLGDGIEAARNLATRIQRQLDRRVGVPVEPGGRRARRRVARFDESAVRQGDHCRCEPRAAHVPRQQSKLLRRTRCRRTPERPAPAAADGQRRQRLPPNTHEPLPAFAQAILSHLAVPPSSLCPTDTTLPNGLRLIVQPEHITGPSS